MTTPQTRPEPCANCGSCSGIAGRGLCGPCYSDGALRCCYSASGEKIADLPRPRAEESEYRGPPPPAAAGRRGPGRSPRRPSRRGARRPPHACPPEDDAAVLGAVDQLTGTGRYRIEGTGGTTAASVVAVIKRAGLANLAGRLAIDRLVAAGVLERCVVRTLRAGVGLGRSGAGLRRAK